MQDLLLFPFNGNAIEALDALGGHYRLIGFIDDTPEKQGMSTYGYPVFDRSALQQYPDARVLAVPGGPNSFREREKVIASLGVKEERWATLIHPSASVSVHAKVGVNCLLMAGVVITSNAVIGDHVCLLPNSVLHHDSEIGSYTMIGSGVCIAGHTHVGRNCYIGSGSNIKDHLNIGSHSLIGMGSNVIRDVAGNGKVAGNPARAI